MSVSTPNQISTASSCLHYELGLRKLGQSRGGRGGANKHQEHDTVNTRRHITVSQIKTRLQRSQQTKSPSESRKFREIGRRIITPWGRGWGHSNQHWLRIYEILPRRCQHTHHPTNSVYALPSERYEAAGSENDVLRRISHTRARKRMQTDSLRLTNSEKFRSRR